MSGRDETFIPPDRDYGDGRKGGEATPPPPRTAPPSFGHSASATEPVVVFQTAQGPPSAPIFTARSSPASDAEETVTSRGTPPADPAGGVADTDAGETTREDGTTVRAEEAGQTETAKTRALAWVGAATGATTGSPIGSPVGDPFKSSSETTGPPLIPDAILPPGIPPESPPEPPPSPDMTTGPIPRLGPGPVPGDRRKRPFSARRALLLGGSAVAALLVAAGGALAYTTLSDDETRPHHRAARPGPARTTTLPSPVRSKKPKPKPKPAAPVDIRDERTDPKPLTTSEVFPHHRLKIAGRTFILAKSVINDHCSLAANGPFADELTRQHCRRVVRATFVSADKKIAVTTGLAVMPTDAAASAALKIQDPAHYESFRGMRAKGAAEIDKAGGIAASGLRGRYIVYAYAMYADGHKAKADDKTLKAVAGGFRDSTAKPIEKRADDGRARD